LAVLKTDSHGSECRFPAERLRQRVAELENELQQLRRKPTTSDMKLLQPQAHEVSRRELREAEQALIQHISGVATWTWCPAAGELTWSEEMYPIYGLDRARISPTFRTWLKSILRADRTRVLKELRTAISGEGPFDSMFRIVRPSGEIRWISTKASIYPREAVPGEARGPVVVGASMDVTERVLADESRLALAAIVESSDDAIIGTSLDGTLTSWNTGAQRLFGYSADEILGKPVAIMAWYGHEGEMAEILERIQRGERIQNFDTFQRHKDGHRIAVSLTISPIRDSAGAVIGAAKIARDITARKQMEEELVRSNEELQQFAYAASHDLQEPLRSIAVYSELLTRNLEGSLTAENQHNLQFIAEAARRMSDLVTGLLAYSRLTTQQGRWTTFTASDALTAAIENLRTYIEEKQATITHDELPVITADRSRIIAVFQNLISNAIKYHADQIPQVHVSAEPEKGGYRFSIADNGIGIDPRHRERIFNIFARLMPKVYGGTGVGLAICKRVIEAHGGRIWVESNGPRGTKFVFTLPNARVE
jgi:PAS domain S-box-containing protein